MRRASPPEMRKALEAVDTMRKAGILFVPMPVLDIADGVNLLLDMTKRIEQLELDAEESQA